MENKTRASMYCTVTYGTATNDNGMEQPSVTLRCPECGKEASAWGHEGPSIRRACWLLSSECEEAPGAFFYKAGNTEKPDDSESSDELPF